MDLLSAVGVVTKRRSDYYGQAETLAKKTGSQEALEERMTKESKALVKGLRDKQLKWSEYERSLMDKTLVSALAAVYLGAGGSKPRDKMETAWPSIVGDILPPLVKFMSETETYLKDGTLRVGDDTLEFADADWDKYFDDDFEVDGEDQEHSPIGGQAAAVGLGSSLTGVMPDSSTSDKNPKLRGDKEAKKGSAQGKTWPGLAGRVARYLATATWSFFNLGKFLVARGGGNKEMRRVARHDKRTCPDCVQYDGMGWQPIGTLPMPGKGCVCYDRCRCHIEYR